MTCHSNETSRSFDLLVTKTILLDRLNSGRFPKEILSCDRYINCGQKKIKLIILKSKKWFCLHQKWRKKFNTEKVYELPYLSRYRNTLDPRDTSQILLVSDWHGVSHHPPVKAHTCICHYSCVPIVDMDWNVNLQKNKFVKKSLQVILMLVTLYTGTYIYIAIRKSQGKGKGEAEVRNIPCMSWPLWERISIPQRKIFQVEFLQQVLDIQR